MKHTLLLISLISLAGCSEELTGLEPHGYTIPDQTKYTEGSVSVWRTKAVSGISPDYLLPTETGSQEISQYDIRKRIGLSYSRFEYKDALLESFYGTAMYSLTDESVLDLGTISLAGSEFEKYPGYYQFSAPSAGGKGELLNKGLRFQNQPELKVSNSAEIENCFKKLELNPPVSVLNIETGAAITAGQDLYLELNQVLTPNENAVQIYPQDSDVKNAGLSIWDSSLVITARIAAPTSVIKIPSGILSSVFDKFKSSKVTFSISVSGNRYVLDDILILKAKTGDKTYPLSIETYSHLVKEFDLIR